MVFSRNHDNQKAYPAVPESLRSDSFDVRKAQESRVNTAPYITPYLGLRSRLSQIWINRWTILLLLVLVRVVILVAQLNDNTEDAKSKALSACTKVEDVGSAMASMPHYLSLGVNNMAATGIEEAVHAMVLMLDLILQGVEAIVVFYINFLVGTYVCLITGLIKGSLDAVASAIDDASDDIKNLVDDVTKEIDDISGDIDSGLNKVMDKIQDVFFGGGVDMPKVDFSEPVNKLKDFDIDPDDFAKDVRKVNEDIPDFDQVKNMTKEAISIPFDHVRKSLNDSYGGYKFDRDVFPLAQKEQMTFCSDNDTLNSFFQGLFDMIHKSKIIFIVILTLLAVAVMAPMAWLEIRRWRRQQKHARLVETHNYDPMDIVYIASRPVTSSWGIKLGSRFSGKRQVLLRWCWAYATSTPAIFVLSLALAGFFSCLCQAILLQAFKKEVPALSKEVGAFADDVVGSLNGVSEKWAGEANGVITGLNNDINDDVLGYVKNATDAVNDTLTTFMDTMNDGLESVFNDTILIDPIKTVIHCVVGIKVETVQKGLTWVHDHAKVSLPLFANDTFSLGAKDSVDGDSDLNTFLASPSSVTTDEVSGAVEKVVEWLHNNIIQEALISTGILLIYVIVVLMGVIRVLMGMAGRDKTRAEGGVNYMRDDQPPPDPREPPQAWYGDGTYPRYGSEVQVESSGGNKGGFSEKFSSGAMGARPRHAAGYPRSNSSRRL